jgi:hypothetical protein
VGLTHKNLIYNNKAVTLTSDQALDDPDDSGFFLPLVYSTLGNLPLVSQNQVCLESTLLVFNCFEVVKQKWYQTWIFKLVLVVVSIGIGVMTGGAGLAGTMGLLGTNAAVGAAIGLSGIAGAIAGAVVNAVATMILTHLISVGATKLLGEKWGAIVGSILAVVAGMGLSGMNAGGFQWNSLLRADNLMKLTEAGIGGYQKALAGETQSIYADMQALQQSYEARSSEIERLSQEMLGSASGFNPLQMTQLLQTSAESSDSFLSRTLMTGSDIAQLTQEMISDFASQTLTLPR